jgi:hypothetical protein
MASCRSISPPSRSATPWRLPQILSHGVADARAREGTVALSLTSSAGLDILGLRDERIRFSVSVSAGPNGCSRPDLGNLGFDVFPDRGLAGTPA